MMEAPWRCCCLLRADWEVRAGKLRRSDLRFVVYAVKFDDVWWPPELYIGESKIKSGN
jgi:hypothetical protein